MSTFARMKYTCSVCGAESVQNVMTSTNSMGSPDLDLRPPGMKRHTMHGWVQICPECGYVSARLSEPAPVDYAFVQESGYVTCDGIRFCNELAVRFYRLYLIGKKTGDHKLAAHAALYAAWACDDSGEMENAVLCRKRAAAELELYLEEAGDNEENWVLLADLMRRAGMYQDVVRRFSDLEFHHELLNQLILFEVEKAKQGDHRCYQVSDAVG